MSGRCLVMVFVVAAVLCGCAAQEKPQPLTPGAFAPPRHEKSTPMEPLSEADQPGALRSPRGARPAPAPPETPQPLEAVPPVVPEDSRQGSGRTTEATAQATAPADVGVSSGQYLQVGGVVVDVNGTPIYANHLIRRAEPVLAARAKELDEKEFKAAAMIELRKAAQELVSEQLTYAAAEQNLEQRDKDLADMLTMRWRQEQINAAGGSETVARQRAAARGEEFDDLVRQKYREFMSHIYIERKIRPRVQPSAAEIRSYYERDPEREFTQPGAARFRLIKIDHARRGGRAEALRFVTELRNRIVKAGESFMAIAHSANDDPRLAKSGGDLGTAIEKGAFAITQVDQAVWNTQVGKVTEIIEAPGAFYLALVEEKSKGKVLPFDEEVQTRIEKKLSNDLFRKQRVADDEKLIKAAIIRSSDSMMNVALEMAVQNYPRWAGK